MRVWYRFLGSALLIGVASFAQARAEEYSLTFLFGPGFAATARQGARAAASASRHWFGTTKTTVELMRAGSLDALSIDAAMAPKEMEQVFTEAADRAHATDPAAFLTSLDAAVQAAGLRPGTRIVIAVLNSPHLSGDLGRTVEHLVGLCKTNGVRVIVLDIVEPGAKSTRSPLELLTRNTGGAWARQARELETSLLTVTQTAIAEAAPAPAAAAAQNEIPVYARFIRTSSTGAAGGTGMGGTGANSVDFDLGATFNERAFEANDASGPMQGLMMAESPLSALKFQMDSNAGTYRAHARIVVLVRNSQGAPVWSGQKELDIRGPARSLDLRRQGSLLFLRSIMVPGHDRFTIDAKVEDLLAGTSGSIQTPLRGGLGAPGLMASDALFVRPFKGSADKFEADQVFSYEGRALAPVLNPVFPGGEEISFELYLVLYPDIHGAPPEMSLEIVREGHVVIRMPMLFKSQIVDPSREGKGTAVYGVQAREFPYLANIQGTKLAAGDYGAIVTVRQGKSVITRSVPFRVLAERGN